MRRKGLLYAAMLCAGPIQAADTPDWPLKATSDIHAIHDILRDNHPGPVNTADPAFSRWLEEGRRQALAKARRASSAGDYWRALRLYTNGFRDGHLGIWPKGEAS